MVFLLSLTIASEEIQFNVVKKRRGSVVFINTYIILRIYLFDNHDCWPECCGFLEKKKSKIFFNLVQFEVIKQFEN